MCTSSYLVLIIIKAGMTKGCQHMVLHSVCIMSCHIQLCVRTIACTFISANPNCSMNVHAIIHVYATACAICTIGTKRVRLLRYNTPSKMHSLSMRFADCLVVIAPLVQGLPAPSMYNEVKDAVKRDVHAFVIRV